MKVASLRKTVVYSIRKAMDEYTCGQAKKRHELIIINTGEGTIQC